MSKNTHYCVIDHMGSLNENEIAECYGRANWLAETFGYKLIFRIKEFAKMYYPRARNIDGVKWVIRNQRCPEQVLFICPNDLTAKIKSGINAWENRGIHVILIQPRKVRPYEPTEKEKSMYYDYGEVDSKRRMIASIWAPALGWQFQYPLYRTPQDEIPDVYLKMNRPGVEKDMLSKLSTRSESYLEAKRAIVSPEELNKFFEFYVAIRNSGIPIEEYLEPDYKICPKCGRPYRAGEGSQASCPRCDNVIEDTEIISYFDDRGEEFAVAEDEYFVETEEGSNARYFAFSTDVKPGFFCGIPVGKDDHKGDIGSTTLTGSDYSEAWKWYSTYEDGVTE